MPLVHVGQNVFKRWQMYIPTFVQEPGKKQKQTPKSTRDRTQTPPRDGGSRSRSDSRGNSPAARGRSPSRRNNINSKNDQKATVAYACMAVSVQEKPGSGCLRKSGLGTSKKIVNFQSKAELRTITITKNLTDNERLPAIKDEKMHNKDHRTEWDSFESL